MAYNPAAAQAAKTQKFDTGAWDALPAPKEWQHLFQTTGDVFRHVSEERKKREHLGPNNAGFRDFDYWYQKLAKEQQTALLSQAQKQQAEGYKQQRQQDLILRNILSLGAGTSRQRRPVISSPQTPALNSPLGIVSRNAKSGKTILGL